VDTNFRRTESKIKLLGCLLWTEFLIKQKIKIKHSWQENRNKQQKHKKKKNNLNEILEHNYEDEGGGK
jgi:hypothetical protein